MSEVDRHYGLDAEPLAESPRRTVVDAARDAAATVGVHADHMKDKVAQAGAWTRGRYDDATDWVSDTYQSASRTATYARRRSAIHAGRGYRSVEDFVDENPVMVGVVGLAAGLLLGALLPGTRRENRYIGAYADDVKGQGLRFAQDLAEQGRHVVEDSLTKVSQGARQTQRQG